MPGLVLAASYLGFGSLVRSSGLEIGAALFSTFSAWALPGQVALVELYGLGASLALIFATVALTNARFLPMTVVVVPNLHAERWPRWLYYAAAHLIAVTGWVFAMQRCPELPEDERLPYFLGFTSVLWTGSAIGTTLGFLLSGVLPHALSLGLVFLNPIYFMLIFAADLKERSRLLSLAIGALLGPLIYLVSPDWSLPITGIVAGSAAFGLDRALRRGGR